MKALRLERENLGMLICIWLMRLEWKFVCFLGVFINGAACMGWRFSLFSDLQEMIPPTSDRISGPGPILSRRSDCEEAWTNGCYGLVSCSKRSVFVTPTSNGTFIWAASPSDAWTIRSLIYWAEMLGAYIFIFEILFGVLHSRKRIHCSARELD